MDIGPTAIHEPKIYDCSAFEEGKTVVQFRDNELMLTDMGGRPVDDTQIEIINQARQTRYSGKMTKQAQKRMTRAITLLSQCTKAKWITNPINGRLQYFKLSMITLTISAKKLIDHREAYNRLLVPMLKWLRYTMNCRHYVWKAELQERGQLHYHIIVPKFIDYRILRDKWNQLQLNASYLREYTAEHKNTNPNSTDIHAVGNEKNVSKYLIKYLGKGADTQALIKRENAERQFKRGEIDKEQLNKIIEDIDQGTQSINGKLWDCSEALNEKYFTVMLKWKLGLVLAEYIKQNPDCVYYGERFCSIQIDFNKPPDFMAGVMPRYRMYLNYINAGGQAILN